MNEKGNFSFVVTFFIVAFGLSFLFIVVSPSLQKYNTALFKAAEPIITDANAQAQGLTNSSVKSQLTSLYNSQADNTTTQADILSILYNYAWLIILVLTAIITFLLSRSIVEAQTGRYA
jgi:hypothetical protein